MAVVIKDTLVNLSTVCYVDVPKGSGKAAFHFLDGHKFEFPFDPPEWTPERRDYILPAPIEVDDQGYVTLPDAPGLGVTLDWAALEALRIDTGTMEMKKK